MSEQNEFDHEKQVEQQEEIKQQDGDIQQEEEKQNQDNKQISMESKEAVFQVFKKFDKDNSGSIDYNEVKQLAAELNVVLESDDFLEIFQELEVNNDKHIDFDEFWAWWSRGRPNKLEKMVYFQLKSMKLMKKAQADFTRMGGSLDAKYEDISTHYVAVNYGESKGDCNLKLNLTNSKFEINTMWNLNNFLLSIFSQGPDDDKAKFSIAKSLLKIIQQMALNQMGFTEQPQISVKKSKAKQMILQFILTLITSTKFHLVFKDIDDMNDFFESLGLDDLKKDQPSNSDLLEELAFDLSEQIQSLLIREENPYKNSLNSIIQILEGEQQIIILNEKISLETNFYLPGLGNILEKLKEYQDKLEF